MEMAKRQYKRPRFRMVQDGIITPWYYHRWQARLCFKVYRLFSKMSDKRALTSDNER